MIIILGGAHATLMPIETITNNPPIDVIIKNEGEQTIIDILLAIENDTDLDSINGITYRKNGTVIDKEQVSDFTDLDNLPFLAYHLLPWSEYKPQPPHGLNKPFTAFITSRGCPYRCSYCSKPIFGSKFRSQSAKRVVDEIEYFVNTYGIKEIAFYDDVFTLNRKRTYEIAEEILRRGLRIDWTCETRVNLVDKELLAHMKKAGCYKIAYGIESASQEILSALNKDITIEMVEKAIRATQEVKMLTVGYFMIGSPHETAKTAKDTIEFAKRLKLDFAQFALTMPYPGTELWNIYTENKQVVVPWDKLRYDGSHDELTPAFESEAMNKRDLKYWVKRAYADYYLRPEYIWQRINKVRSIGDIANNINGLSVLLKRI
jgi:radical SAM superfamily enzyme YgiQ (UPF0313 family)